MQPYIKMFLPHLNDISPLCTRTFIRKKDVQVYDILILVLLQMHDFKNTEVETSYQYLIGVTLTWLLQHSKHQQGHAENCILLSKLL